MITDRSRCPRCHHVLGLRDLVPVCSYLWSRGRCRYCGARIAVSYPLLEISTAALFTIFFMRDGLALPLVFHLTALIFLIAIFVVDLRTSLIPDRFSLPLIAVGVIGNLILTPSLQVVGPVLARELGFLHTPLLSLYSTSVSYAGVPISLLVSLALGIAGGAGFFLLQILISGGKWVGGGDVRLGAAMGALLGLEGLMVALGIAYLVGALAGLILISMRRTRIGGYLPFGPYLVGGTMVAMLYGHEILVAYLRFIGFSLST